MMKGHRRSHSYGHHKGKLEICFLNYVGIIPVMLKLNKTSTLIKKPTIFFRLF